MVNCLKKISVIGYVLLLTTMLIVGMYYADLNTRAVGFEDAKPVFYCNISEDEIYLHFMGKELNINSNDNSLISSVTKYSKKTVPLRTKFAKALNDFIRMITGLFLRAVGQ